MSDSQRVVFVSILNDQCSAARYIISFISYILLTYQNYITDNVTVLEWLDGTD